MVRPVDLTAPSALLRAMIEGTLPYDGYAARRAALKLTGRIPNLDMAARLHDELFAELDCMLIQIGPDDPLKRPPERHRLNAKAALDRNVALCRQ